MGSRLPSWTDNAMKCSRSVTSRWRQTVTDDAIIRWNRSRSASDSAYSYNSPVALSVRRLSVCHIRAPCLNRSTDLDAIWQVHLCGPRTHCVTWDPRGRGDLVVEHPNHAIANCNQTVSPMLPPGEYKRGTIPLFAKLVLVMLREAVVTIREKIKHFCNIFHVLHVRTVQQLKLPFYTAQ